jgi:D-3-phosphoglycerate dehydrogenase
MSVPMKSLDELLSWPTSSRCTFRAPRKRRTCSAEEQDAPMKKGAYLINAARGGLVDEDALLKLLDEGHLAGAALDTFVTEPLQKDSPLRNNPKLILTPHLGASTSRGAAGREHDPRAPGDRFLETGAVAGCVNLPPLSAEAAREVGPWMPLMSALGKLAARLVPAPSKLQVTYRRPYAGARHAAADAPAGRRAARSGIGPRSRR